MAESATPPRPLPQATAAPPFKSRPGAPLEPQAAAAAAASRPPHRLALPLAAAAEAPRAALRHPVLPPRVAPASLPRRGSRQSRRRSDPISPFGFFRFR